MSNKIYTVQLSGSFSKTDEYAFYTLSGMLSNVERLVEMYSKNVHSYKETVKEITKDIKDNDLMKDVRDFFLGDDNADNDYFREFGQGSDVCLTIREAEVLDEDSISGDADDYEVHIFDNFEELEKEYPEVAANLIKEHPLEDWGKESLMLYPSLVDHVKYELSEGWYRDFVEEASDSGFNGAPNPLNFIDYVALGQQMREKWDESCTYYDEKFDVVVTTSFGWN